MCDPEQDQDPTDHVHVWDVLRSWPVSWRCRVCREIVFLRPEEKK